MKQPIVNLVRIEPQMFIGTTFFSLLLCLGVLTSSPVSAVEVTSSPVIIPPGVGSAQEIVNANPPGSTYLIGAGVHQYLNIAPQDNDVYLYLV